MANQDKKPILVWFRKDLRLADNAALAMAASGGAPVICLFIREPEDAGTGPLGSAQRWWLHHSLAALSRALEAKGARLVLKSGEALSVIEAMIAEAGIGAVFWNRRYDPAGIAIDTALKAALRERGIEAKSFAGQILHEPAKLLTAQKTGFKVFTPFWRALQAAGEPPEPLSPPPHLSPPADWPQSENLHDWRLLPAAPDWAAAFHEIWRPGEAGADEKLNRFVKEGLGQYKARRDCPADTATSLLSPHLALGEITPNRMWHAVSAACQAKPEDIAKFRQEIAWRDFSYHLLYHFPDLATRNWNDRFDRFDWRGTDGQFDLWKRGMTGYPIVDAGMRQLWRHGFMHNRVRMITASFLIKDLLIDWRRGERWFRDTLVDADPASNAASWQWVAGSGADAAPYFRIFNPVLQGEKFDTDGRYVRAFVPELAGLEDRYVHRPFEAPRAVLDKAGVVLGKTYPRPLVNHGRARDAALAAFKATEGA